MSNNIVFESEQVDGIHAPRRSQRVAADLAPSDGDIWQEKLAVCEGVSPDGEPRLIIRSFYRNGRTKERVWDEPPSGAGVVLHATSEMRKEAEMEREELRLTLDMIPPEEEQSVPLESDKKEKKGFFGRFRKKKESKPEVEPAKDLNLQRAIARSLAAEHTFGGSDEPQFIYDQEESKRVDAIEEEEELALAQAMALSLSLAENEEKQHTVSEDEMFQRALERSRHEAQHSAGTGVASMPNPLDDSFSSFASPSPEHPSVFDPNESDRKLPAIPFGNSSSQPPIKFDPYGK